MTTPSPTTSTAAASRRDGAAVGLGIGLIALGLGLASGELWLAAGVPAGVAAGAAVAPHVVRNRPIRRRTVLLAAFVATITGDAAIALPMVLDPVHFPRTVLDFAGNVAGVWLLGLLSGGWLAMPPLVVIAWAGCVILRRRMRRPTAGAALETTRSAWLAGLVVGCAAGLLALSIPIVGWELAIAFAVGALLNPGTALACGGLLVGAGATWSALLLQASSRCATDASAFDSCVAPDLGPWFAIGFGMLVAGAILTALSIADRRSAGSRSS